MKVLNEHNFIVSYKAFDISTMCFHHCLIETFTIQELSNVIIVKNTLEILMEQF